MQAQTPTVSGDAKPKKSKSRSKIPTTSTTALPAPAQHGNSSHSTHAPVNGNNDLSPWHVESIVTTSAAHQNMTPAVATTSSSSEKHKHSKGVTTRRIPIVTEL